MPLEGVDEGLRNLEAKMKAVWDHTGVAWKDTVDVNVLNVSLTEVPVKTGSLRESGRNDMTSTSSEHTCEVGYGSEAVQYAFIQHERLDFHHPAITGTRSEARSTAIAKYGGQYSWTPDTPSEQYGKAKYLEDPVNAAAPRLMGELKKRLAGEI